MKEVIGACLCQTLRFASKQEFKQYLEKLDSLGRAYRVDSEEEQPKGHYLVRIRKQANDWSVGDYLQ
ncbi:MAG: hypothetical protein WCR70_06080 [Sphaerochaetaceae bacterium]|jgi:hypothetical protein